MGDVAVRCVREYMKANPGAPAVLELRAALDGLLGELAAIEDAFERTVAAIKAFGKRGPGLVEEHMRRTGDDESSR